MHADASLPLAFARSTGVLDARLDAQIDAVGSRRACQGELNGLGDLLGVKHLLVFDRLRLFVLTAYLHVDND